MRMRLAESTSTPKSRVDLRGGLITHIRRAKQPAGFTLIEVSIATAVAAVAMVGLMLVLMAASSVARKAADDTLQSVIVQELFSEVRSRPFTAVWVANASGAPLAPAVDLSSFSSNYASLYFDPNGNRVDAGPQYFKCSITFAPMELTGQLAMVKFEFVEPAHSLNPIITNIFYGRIVRKDLP